MVYSFSRDVRAYTGRALDQAAYAMLVILAAGFAFELTRPPIDGKLMALTNVETIILLMSGLWILSMLAASRTPGVPEKLLLPGAVWLAVLTLSAFLAPAFQDKAFLFLGRIYGGVLVGLAAYNLADTPGRWRTLLVALASGVTLVAALGLAEGFAVEPVVDWLARFKVAQTRVGDVLRVSATLSYATITAMVLELVLPLVLALFLIARHRGLRLLAGIAIGLILAAHVLTLSRAGIIALMAALALMAVAGILWKRRNLFIASLITAGVTLGFVALVLYQNPTVRLRLTTETEQAWYQVQYQAPSVVRARSGERIIVPVIVTNVGARTWSGSSRQPFALGYHLYDALNQPVTYDGARSPLPAILSAGDVTEVQAQILAPTEPGEYLIEWDMVQESVTWFSWQEASTATTRLLVIGRAAAPIASDVSSPPTDIRIVNPTPGRLELWRAALRMFVDYPLTGVGPDSFRWQYGAYAGVEQWDTGIHANNLYIEWLADTGVVGLLVFLWFSWRLANVAMSRLRGLRQEEFRLLALGLAAGLAAWYVHGLFDYFYEFTPTYVAFWLVVALLVGVPRWRQHGSTDRI